MRVPEENRNELDTNPPNKGINLTPRARLVIECLLAWASRF